MLADTERHFIMFVGCGDTLLQVKVCHIQAALRFALAHGLAHRGGHARVCIQDAISGERCDPVRNWLFAVGNAL